MPYFILFAGSLLYTIFEVQAWLFLVVSHQLLLNTDSTLKAGTQLACCIRMCSLGERSSLDGCRLEAFCPST